MVIRTALLLLVISSAIHKPAKDEYAKDERGVEELRKMKDYVPAPVNTGFVFINGKYIAPPYQLKLTKVLKLEHKEGDCYLGGGILSLNGQLNENHVIRKSRLFKGDKFPAVPDDIKKDTSMDDHKVSVFMAKAKTYIKLHHSHKEECDIVADAYKKLPNIKRTRRINKDILEIETYNGKTYHYLLNIFRRKGPNFPEFYKQIIRRCKQYQKRLEDGGVLFFSSRSGDMQIPGGTESITLIKALNSAKTPEERSAVARKFGMDHYFSEYFIKNYQPSAQLEKRLKDFRAKKTAGKNPAEY